MDYPTRILTERLQNHASTGKPDEDGFYASAAAEWEAAARWFTILAALPRRIGAAFRLIRAAVPVPGERQV